MKFTQQARRTWSMGYVETDANGNSYFSGYTDANNFPAVNGIFTTSGGNSDGIILKFDMNALRLWATYMGGSSSDMLYHIDVDTSGSVYFGGRTAGGILAIALPGAYNDGSFNGGVSDWHLGKINTSGSSLLWSTYYGGASLEFLQDIKVTPTANRLYIVGSTSSSGFPICTKTGAYNSGTGNSVIVEFDSALDTTWSVRFGSGGPQIYGIDGDMNDGFFLTGQLVQGTSAVPFVNPGGGAYFDNTPWSVDMFIVRLNLADTVTWGTTFGGGLSDSGLDIVKTGKDIVIVGETSSALSNGFPLKANIAAGEYKDSVLNQNNPDCFIARFSVGGVWEWSTFFGGVGTDLAIGVIADKSSTIYITGGTFSWDYDLQPYGNAYQQSPNLGDAEAFIAAFSPTNHLLWSTCFGGLQFEGGGELATFVNEYLYFGGNSSSSSATFPWDFPNGGYIDTNKISTAYGTPYVGRFGIQNINVSANELNQPSFTVTLYPNPTDGATEIEIAGLYGDDVEIVICDVLGRVVNTRKIEGVFGTLYQEIETSPWSSGIYYVAILTSNHGVVTKKMIRQ